MEQLLEKIKDRVSEKASPIRTVKGVAGAIGMSEAGFYTMLKKGTTKYGTLLAIAQTLDVDVSYFSESYNNSSATKETSRVTGSSIKFEQQLFELKQIFEEQLKVKDRQIEKLLDLLGKPEGAIADLLSTDVDVFEMLYNRYRQTAYSQVRGQQSTARTFSGKVSGTPLALVAN